jgi:hypothetical protein
MTTFFNTLLVDVSGNKQINSNFLSYRPYIKTYKKLDIIKSGTQKIRLEVGLSNLSNENTFSDFSIWILNQDKQPINTIISNISIDLNGKQIDQIINPEVQLNYLEKVFETNKSLNYNKYTVIPLYGLFKSNPLDWTGQKIVVHIEFNGSCLSQDSVDLYAYKYFLTDSSYNMIPKPSNYLYYTNQFFGGESINASNIKLRLNFDCLAQSLYLWADGFDRTQIKKIRLHFDGCEYLNLSLDQLDYLAEVNVSGTSSPVVIKFTKINQLEGLVNFSKIESAILTVELKEKCETVLNVVAFGLKALV